MSTGSFNSEEVINWMVSLVDVAYLKWSKENADLLSFVMANYKPKKMSARKLAEMTKAVGFPVSHETINRMRKGVTVEVAPENLVGICLALSMDLKTFLTGPLAKMDNIPSKEMTNPLDKN